MRFRTVSGIFQDPRNRITARGGWWWWWFKVGIHLRLAAAVVRSTEDRTRYVLGGGLLMILMNSVYCGIFLNASCFLVLLLLLGTQPNP